MDGLKTGQLRWLQEKEKALRAEDPMSPSLREEKYSRWGARALCSSVTKSPEGIQEERWQDPHLCSDLFYPVMGLKTHVIWSRQMLLFLFLKCSAYFDGIRRRKRLGKYLWHGTEKTEEMPLLEDCRRLQVRPGGSNTSSMHWHRVPRGWRTAQGKGFAAQAW